MEEYITQDVQIRRRGSVTCRWSTVTGYSPLPPSSRAVWWFRVRESGSK